MVTRKRKVIVIVVSALFVAGLAMFLFTHDSGPPVVVHGNLSAKDVAQIKSAVRRQLWRDALPNLSEKSIMAFPKGAKRAFTIHVSEIYPVVLSGTKGTRAAVALFSERSWQIGYCLTNGPGGWSFNRSVLAPTL